MIRDTTSDSEVILYPTHSRGGEVEQNRATTLIVAPLHPLDPRRGEVPHSPELVSGPTLEIECSLNGLGQQAAEVAALQDCEGCVSATFPPKTSRVWHHLCGDSLPGYWVLARLGIGNCSRLGSAARPEWRGGKRRSRRVASRRGDARRRDAACRPLTRYWGQCCTSQSNSRGRRRLAQPVRAEVTHWISPR